MRSQLLGSAALSFHAVGSPTSPQLSSEQTRGTFQSPLGTPDLQWVHFRNDWPVMRVD